MSAHRPVSIGATYEKFFALYLGDRPDMVLAFGLKQWWLMT